jgi:hypothetical protein
MRRLARRCFPHEVAVVDAPPVFVASKFDQQAPHAHAALCSLLVAWSRYTAYGIYLGGGGRYWVNRAGDSPSDAEAREHLRRVLLATQYGVNVAENAVRLLPRRNDR